MMLYTDAIDKFGRSLKENDSDGNRGPPGVGFKLSEKGDYSLEHKRMIKVGEPVDSEDATTRAWVEKQINEIDGRIKENEKLTESVKQTENEHYEFHNRKADDNHLAAFKKVEDVKSAVEKNFQLKIEDMKKQTINDLEASDASLRDDIDGYKTSILSTLKETEAALRRDMPTVARSQAHSVVGAELKAFAYAIHKKFELYPTDLGHEAALKKTLNNPKSDWRALLNE